MAKTTGPLFSSGAQGTIGKTLTYGKATIDAWVRAYFSKKYTRTEAQSLVRTWFKYGVDNFHDMSNEERWLWDLALQNYKEYNRRKVSYLVGKLNPSIGQIKRMARCLFLHHVILDRAFTWNGSPFPPELKQMMAKDEIAGYNQIVSDLETLTGLSFCMSVDPYFFPYLGYVTSEKHPDTGNRTAGICNNQGLAIALSENYYKSLGVYNKKKLIAHELTHAIMDHHGWNYRTQVLRSETIANECGIRIADGDLTPVYIYRGETLSSWVDDPTCP